MAWRRVSKSENYVAWKARRYTDGTRTISRVEYERLERFGGEKYHASIKKRIEERGYTPQGRKANRSRNRTKELKELMRRYSFADFEDEPEYEADLSADARLIQKYAKERAARGRPYKQARQYYKNGRPKKTDFEKDFTAEERARFKELFSNEIHQYPEDMVRRWLGSSERSIQLRHRGG